MTDFEQPTMNCPKCGKEYEDFDGVGVIYCPPPEGCGFCRHVTRSGQPDGSMKCDYCGDIEPGSAPMTDIAAIRKRADRGNPHYASVGRPETEDLGLAARILQDAVYDREDLLREVDRLEAELRKTKSLAGESEAWAEAKSHEADAKRIEIAELNRALDQARTAAQNEATQRQKAEAENERLRSALKESQAAWAQENAAAENYLGHMKTFGDEIAKLRALLSSCRPVVEFVREFADMPVYVVNIDGSHAETCRSCQAKKLIAALPTLPEKP